MASSAIPKIFPPLEVGGKIYIDGGIPTDQPHRLDSLKGCSALIVLEMIGPDDPAKPSLNPLTRWEASGRAALRAQMDAALRGTAEWACPPRVFRLSPEPRLDFSMLSFRGRNCVPALGQGRRNANEFLEKRFRP